MAKSKRWQWIPTSLTLAQFEQFVLPHLLTWRRGPAPKLSLHGIFNYVLRLLHMGCQWQELPIEKDTKGLPEIHYTRIYRMFRYWQAQGCIDAIFVGSVLTLHQRGYLDTRVLHGVSGCLNPHKSGCRKWRRDLAAEFGGHSWCLILVTDSGAHGATNG